MLIEGCYKFPVIEIKNVGTCYKLFTSNRNILTINGKVENKNLPLTQTDLYNTQFISLDNKKY